jgi:hypothetical protein
MSSDRVLGEPRDLLQQIAANRSFSKLFGGLDGGRHRSLSGNWRRRSVMNGQAAYRQSKGATGTRRRERRVEGVRRTVLC